MEIFKEARIGLTRFLLMIGSFIALCSGAFIVLAALAVEVS